MIGVGTGGLTCPARGVLEKVGKIVARREASADGLPPLEVARVPRVARRAGLKGEFEFEFEFRARSPSSTQGRKVANARSLRRGAVTLRPVKQTPTGSMRFMNT